MIVLKASKPGAKIISRVFKKTVAQFRSFYWTKPRMLPSSSPMVTYATKSPKKELSFELNLATHKFRTHTCRRRKTHTHSVTNTFILSLTHTGTHRHTDLRQYGVRHSRRLESGGCQWREERNLGGKQSGTSHRKQYKSHFELLGSCPTNTSTNQICINQVVHK